MVRVNRCKNPKSVKEFYIRYRNRLLSQQTAFVFYFWKFWGMNIIFYMHAFIKTVTRFTDKNTRKINQVAEQSLIEIRCNRVP